MPMQKITRASYARHSGRYSKKATVEPIAATRAAA
jgi:hypothetical protein